MIYLSAGHHNSDPGAVANGYKESELCIKIRDAVAKELDKRGYKYILDKDSETLSQYIARIKPGSGSVVCDIHFNAVANSTATGVEVFYKNDNSKPIAASLSAELARVQGLKDRGAKGPKESNRGSLAILNTKAGIAVLPEIGFISNKNDLKAFFDNFDKVINVIACNLIYAENLYS